MERRHYFAPARRWWWLAHPEDAHGGRLAARARLLGRIGRALLEGGPTAVALLLVGCQVFIPQATEAQPPPEPRRIIGRASVATPGPRPGALELTAPVKRGTLVEAVTLSGNAFPLRIVQLVFPGSGTVEAVLVRSGQTVREGQRVVEFAVGAASLQEAATRPTVAVTAPFDALVTTVPLSVGQTVTPQTTAARLVDISRFYVTANATEFDVLRLQPGQAVEVTFPAVFGQPVGGSIVDVGQEGTVQGDRVVFPVRIDLEGAPDGLRPGMSARINVPIRKAENALYVPAGAIRQVGSGTVVTRVHSGGQISDVPVTAGGRYGGDVEILNGLNEGDLVAVSAASPAR